MNARANIVVLSVREVLMKKTFLFTFTLPDPLPEDFVIRIPDNRQVINKLMLKKVISFFALAMDRSTAWCTVNAESATEARKIVGRFPLIGWMRYDLKELGMLNTPAVTPAISLN